jgi:nucleotide-binding universal stress UspA family protein
MTVAVAHQGTNDSDHVLLEAVREAEARGEALAVIHVRSAVDVDLEAAVAAGVKDAVERVTKKAGLSDVPYELHVAAGTADDLAGAVLDEADRVKASLLVIGARHRSPVGKAFLGSVSQRLILDADVPVLVVKPPR